MSDLPHDPFDDSGLPAHGVGFCRPPRGSQFQPGKSGNPRGRPKGAKGLKAELKAELDEWVTVTVNGKSQRIRKRRLVIKALASKAAKGNVGAADKLLSLVIQAEGFEDQRTDKRALSDTDELTLSQFLESGEPVVTEADVEPAPRAPRNEASALGPPDAEAGDD